MKFESFFKSTKRFVKRFPRVLGEHPFLAFLGLFGIAVALSALVFYRYGITTKDIQGDAGISETKFQEEIFQRILEEWKDRALRFDAATIKNYPDIFRP